MLFLEDSFAHDKRVVSEQLSNVEPGLLGGLVGWFLKAVS